jgi:hypothetical protein
MKLTAYLHIVPRLKTNGGTQLFLRTLPQRDVQSEHRNNFTFTEAGRVLRKRKYEAL